MFFRSFGNIWLHFSHKIIRIRRLTSQVDVIIPLYPNLTLRDTHFTVNNTQHAHFRFIIHPILSQSIRWLRILTILLMDLLTTRQLLEEVGNETDSRTGGVHIKVRDPGSGGGPDFRK